MTFPTGVFDGFDPVLACLQWQGKCGCAPAGLEDLPQLNYV